MSPSDIVVYDPLDVFDSIERFRQQYGRCECVMFDPWYNKGVGGIRDDYVEYITSVLERLAVIADHIYFWGFPEIVARFIDRIPSGHKFTAWLTWYYKNNPSVIRGWRSAQMACLHTSVPGAKLFPEHFLNEAQIEKQSQGKLRYMPGPPSVIESALIIGFVGKKEQTGHPSQKPMAVYSPLIEMVTKPGDLVFDPMCGSGTTGAVCKKLGRRAVLADINPEYLAMARKRLEFGEGNKLLDSEDDADGFQMSLPF
ncbi:site-specific DNA-methyltransferase [Pseudomonas sp. WS 5503]|uniref:DNA-methyltransferase n=1 Tax=Pseudomonas sp. WS 5503 TaxID=2717497 RepID=UPI0014734639|nr:site-specific DNA-methyltransferase [Pseudomonas sp. WS 5503]NMX79886.1 site-specific DNA-methyltransferase [Pseudomonas sp. WS 5503]